jgi:Signal peptidase subunit
LFLADGRLNPFVTTERNNTRTAPAFLGQARLVLNVSADLRTDFTWCTKQIFLYVQVEFATLQNEVNQAVMWSDILLDRVSASLAFSGLSFVSHVLQRLPSRSPVFPDNTHKRFLDVVLTEPGSAFVAAPS